MMTNTERIIAKENIKKLTDLIIKDAEDAYEEGYRIGYQHGYDDAEDCHVRARNESKD